MDKDTVRKIVQLLSDDDRDMLHKAIQDTLTCTASQPSILTQHWWLDDPVVYDAEGNTPALCDWIREYSALPDMARALKMIERKLERHGELDGDRIYRLYLGSETHRMVLDALKKAGIE